jgi:hypothetical protein
MSRLEDLFNSPMECSPRTECQDKEGKSQDTELRLEESRRLETSGSSGLSPTHSLSQFDRYRPDNQAEKGTYTASPCSSMRVPSPSIPGYHTTMSSETKDLHDGGGDMKDLVDGVQDQVTISPTETEMAILANDAHRYVSRAPRFISILVANGKLIPTGVFECDMFSSLPSQEVSHLFI